ncbi:hypothetical protein PENTCL1PPCAC_13951, partial [Pristionchus entomophagus]
KNFVSGKDPKVIFEENQKLRASLPAAVKGEIDDHIAELAHKIGLLTLSEIIQRLEKLADHIKAHPDEARAKVATLSPAAQKPFGEMVKIFVSDKSPKEKFDECRKIKDALPSEVVGEINAIKEELSIKIGIVPLHHVGHHTPSHDDYLLKLWRLAEHIKNHPDEARAGVAKLSTAAQKPAGDLIKNFVSGKDPKVIFEENQKLKASLPANVKAEIDQHLAEVAHKIGILTLNEIIERLEKLAAHIKAHPDEARAGVAKLSAAAQKPAGDLIKNFVSGKDPKVIFEENQKLRASLPAAVKGEIDDHIAE